MPEVAGWKAYTGAILAALIAAFSAANASLNLIPNDVWVHIRDAVIMIAMSLGLWGLRQAIRTEGKETAKEIVTGINSDRGAQ